MSGDRPHIGDRGFTLIEVVIVVVVIGILAAIAFPSFQNFIANSNRADAHAALQNIQLLQERYRKDQGRYGTLAEIGAPSTSPNGCFSLAIENVGRANYVARATAVPNACLLRTQCTAMTLRASFAGVSKEPPDCWPR
jgi:type IV pilus assembly protein PilE